MSSIRSVGVIEHIFKSGF